MHREHTFTSAFNYLLPFGKGHGTERSESRCDEQSMLEFRWELFNALNQTNFGFRPPP